MSSVVVLSHCWHRADMQRKLDGSIRGTLRTLGSIRIKGKCKSPFGLVCTLCSLSCLGVPNWHDTCVFVDQYSRTVHCNLQIFGVVYFQIAYTGSSRCDFHFSLFLFSSRSAAWKIVELARVRWSRQVYQGADLLMSALMLKPFAWYHWCRCFFVLKDFCWCFLFMFFFVCVQSPIQASLLKLDAKNTQLNKLAVECFIGVCLLCIFLFAFFLLLINVHVSLSLSHQYNKNRLMLWIKLSFFLVLGIMRFMGDYLLKGKQETDLVYFLLKVCTFSYF